MQSCGWVIGWFDSCAPHRADRELSCSFHGTEHPDPDQAEIRTVQLGMRVVAYWLFWGGGGLHGAAGSASMKGKWGRGRGSEQKLPVKRSTFFIFCGGCCRLCNTVCRAARFAGTWGFWITKFCPLAAFSRHLAPGVLCGGGSPSNGSSNGCALVVIVVVGVLGVGGGGVVVVMAAAATAAAKHIVKTL